MLPSIATAVTYFLGRNIYAAIIVQNFMGIVGVMASLPQLEPFRQPMVPVYAVSAVSICSGCYIVLGHYEKDIKKEIQRTQAERGEKGPLTTATQFRLMSAWAHAVRGFKHRHKLIHNQASYVREVK